MLFHITAQHDHLSCGGVAARRDGTSADFQREWGRWMEGNDRVKVLAVYQNQPAHRAMIVIEAETYEDVSVFTNPFKDIGTCEVQLVGDGIAARLQEIGGNNLLETNLKVPWARIGFHRPNGGRHGKPDISLRSEYE